MAETAVIYERQPVQSVEADWLVAWLFEGAESQPPLTLAIDEATGGLVSRLIAAKDATGEHAELCPVQAPSGLAAARLMLVGLGKRDRFALPQLLAAARAAAKRIAAQPRKCVAFTLPEAQPELDVEAVAAAVVQAALVGAHGPGLYKAERKRHEFERLLVLAGSGASQEQLEAGVRRGQAVAWAMNLVRDLVNRPAGEITPSSFADRFAALAAEYGLECSVFDEERIRQERMGALLGAAAGSDQPPRFVSLRYRSPKAADKPLLALAGKGITFDSGGLSLKSHSAMQGMKGDMAGAATVLAAVLAATRLELPVHVTAFAALCENMPGPRALKVGDVLVARNGTTIEVVNTDAEGRLILADALSYAVDFGADHIVDLATLTGSCVIALGQYVAGMMSNDRDWSQRVELAAERAGERLWPLPMFDDYADQLKSHVADVRNVGSRWGGAITAAKFLEKFVAERPWAHIDIAGPAWASEDKPSHDAGGTGAFVPTLVELMARYSSKQA